MKYDPRTSIILTYCGTLKLMYQDVLPQVVTTNIKIKMKISKTHPNSPKCLLRRHFFTCLIKLSNITLNTSKYFLIV